MSFSTFLGMLFWILILRLLRKKTPMKTFTNSIVSNKANHTHPIDSNKKKFTSHQFESLQNFSKNKLKSTRKRTVYLNQYYVNEQPIFGNHQDYYLNYLVNLQPTEITVSTLRVAYQNTIVYPHKCKITAKAAAKYLKDRSNYLHMN